MYRILLLLIFFGLGKALSAQHVYTIKADSVKITNNCDTAELIIENHTQNVSGFLFNKGRGRTEFRKGAFKLNDTAYLIGADTLRIPKTSLITASNGLSMVGNSVQLGGALTSDRQILMNGYGLRLDNGSTVFSNQVTGDNSTALLSLNSLWNTTGSPTGLSINVQNTAARDYFSKLFSVNLSGTGSFPSSFNITKYGGRLLFNYFDTTVGGNAYLSIMSNNVKEGSQGSRNATGVITLQGFYRPSAGNSTACGIMDVSQYDPTGGTTRYCSNYISPYITTAIPPGGKVNGIYYALTYVTGSALPNNSNIAFENYNGNVLLNNQMGDAGGRTAIHINGNAPTAWLHLGAGLATANAAPLKFTSGPVLTTPEEGAVEYDGTDLYLTTAAVRYKLSKTLTGQLTTNFGGASLAAFKSVTTTLPVAGAQPGDVVNVSANTGAVNPPSITISAYVTTANMVTLRAYNADNSVVTIASDTYKVRVIR